MTKETTIAKPLIDHEQWLRVVEKELSGLRNEANTIIKTIRTFIIERGGSLSSSRSAASRGIILEGPTGTGKTALALAVVRPSGYPFLHISGSNVFGRNRGDGERAIMAYFDKARQSCDGDGENGRCSFLILDDLDAIGKVRSKAKHVTDLGILAMLLEALDDVKNASIFVIGIIPEAIALDASLLQPGRLEVIVSLASPALAQRRMILEGLLDRLPLEDGGDDDEDIGEQKTRSLANDGDELGTTRLLVLLEMLARRSRGYTGSDLCRLCSEAMALACRRRRSAGAGAVSIRQTDWEVALEKSRPLGVPYCPMEDADLDELAGIDDIMQMVMQAILLPLSRPEALMEMGVSKASFGVLLHGPPGTGKSTLGRALATVARPYASFLSIECPELINKAVGESERAVARLFQTARHAAPCILFLDHIEAIAGVRGHDTSSEQTMDRLLSTLLIEMDGISSSNGGEEGVGAAASNQMVVVIAATNHLSMLDDAILRPGRLDLHVEMPLPHLQAREAIWLHYLKTLPLTFQQALSSSEESMAEEECAMMMPQSIEELGRMLAQQSEGFSGADIRGICQEAALLSLRDEMDDGGNGDAFVLPRHLFMALHETNN